MELCATGVHVVEGNTAEGDTGTVPHSQLRECAEFVLRNITANGEISAAGEKRGGEVLGAEAVLVREAARPGGEQPTIVGYDVTPDSVRDLPDDSLPTAVDVSIEEPWRVLDAGQSGGLPRGLHWLHPL